MDHPMITPSHSHQQGYIIIANVPLAGLPDTIHVDNYTLQRRDGFHVSLMALKHLAPMIDPDNPESAATQLVDDFVHFTSRTPLDTVRLTSEFRLVTRDERASVIVMVDVPGIDELFDTLRSKYAVVLPTQPTHITLYTLQPNTPIGLLSAEELERDTHVISVPELKTLRIME